MENQISPEEARATLAVLTARMYKNARRVLTMGAVLVVFFSIVVPILTEYSLGARAFYRANETFYVTAPWLGAMFIVVSILMMLCTKVIAGRRF